MKFRKSLLLCLVLTLLSALLCAPALAKVVSPNSDFYYLDQANVLSEALEGEIFFSNKLLYDACGAQIVVVTVPTTGREAIDDYAYDLFNSWGIGDAAKDNGFLLLLAIDDDDYYARTGSGLDRRFSAATIKEYYDACLESDFAAKNYEAGVRKFFEAVFERIATTYNAEVSVADGIAGYNAYVAQNSAAQGFGGYNGTRRAYADGDYDSRDSGDGISTAVVVFVILLIAFIVLMSKGRRARRRAVIMPPPPPPPMGFGYRPTRVVTHGYHAPPRQPSGGGLFGGFSGGGSSSRSSSGVSRSSSRSSFGGGGGRSGGFGGGSGGGGRSSGGGAGRGRH